MQNIAIARPSPQPSRSIRQAQVLARGNKNVVADLKNRVPPRSDLTYTRPKALRGERHELSSAKLLESLLWMHTRRGREWDDTDANTMVEVRARTWGEVQCRAAATHHIPSWFLAVLPGRIAYGCALFCYYVLASHRAGALGVLMSLTETAAICMVSERTVQRWVKKLESTGLLEVVQTWQRNPNQGRKRGYWKHLYRPGPVMRQVVGLGMLEGAKGLGEATANAARTFARVARARLRNAQRSRSDALWRARNKRRAGGTPVARRDDGLRKDRPGDAQRAPSPPLLSLDTLASPSPPPEGRDIRRPSSLRATGVSPAAPHEKARATPALVPATPAASAPPRAVHRPAENDPGRGPLGDARAVPDRAPVPPPPDRSDGKGLFLAWVAENEPPPRPEPPRPKLPDDARGASYVDPWADQRKTLGEIRKRRRQKILARNKDQDLT